MVKARGTQHGTREPMLADAIIEEVRAVSPHYPQLHRLLQLWDVALTQVFWGLQLTCSLHWPFHSQR